MIIKVMTYNIQHGLDYSSRINGKLKTNLEAIKDVINTLKMYINMYKKMYL